MGEILTFLEEDTKGKCYSSYKYCVDDVEVPKLLYEKGEERISVKRKGETATINRTLSVKDIADKQQGKPLFKYFLDGSRRTYKVDDIAYSEYLYPIVAGQIGVSCCYRENENSFKPALTEKMLVLSLPETANYLGTKNEMFFNNIVSKINDLPKLKKRSVEFSKALYYSDRQPDKNTDYNDRAVAKVQDEMIDAEKRVVQKVVRAKKLNYETYLMKDGSLQYKQTNKGSFGSLSSFKDNYRSVVGVSKSFNPEQSKDKKNRSYARVIADLKLYHRTPAFMYETGMVGNVKFCIWYLRIRATDKTISPFDGVVKIEKVLVTDDEQEYGLDSDEVDLISANIINERTPTAYGHDTRWANHLYPVYLTEKYLKSLYLSDAHFLNLF